MNDFAKKTGVHIDTIRNIRDGKVKITVKTAKRIVDIFDNIRFDWVLKGEGEMLNISMVNESPPNYQDMEMLKKLQEENIRLKARLFDAEEELNRYKNPEQKRKAGS